MKAYYSCDYCKMMWDTKWAAEECESKHPTMENLTVSACSDWGYTIEKWPQRITVFDSVSGEGRIYTRNG